MQLCAWLPSLWTGMRLKVTLLWYKPCCFSNANYFVILLIGYWCQSMYYSSYHKINFHVLLIWIPLFVSPSGAAVHLASLLAAYGYIFSITDHHLMVKDDASYYRFQVRISTFVTFRGFFITVGRLVIIYFLGNLDLSIELTM